ncbi:MAG: L-rhamnose isomerase [Candidatus Latescibacteria bacterium]|nr:L-rhamnose isomerase [Candidatus Latescibacterota bacterium]
MTTIPQLSAEQIDQQYTHARARYADFGVDTEAAIAKALSVPISLHCWQTDDVEGLESAGLEIAGSGIMATGNYPGKARSGDEIRADLAQVMALLPGIQRVNLHASYAEMGDKPADRDRLETTHFARWIDWAKNQGIGLDFNTTYFAHPKGDDGYTLSHADKEIRDFWVRHAVACRRIAEDMARAQGSPCILNHWIPDGSKDLTADRFAPRQRLVESYDELLHQRHGIDTELCVDAVESKLFGLASEEYVVGSAEFYSNYALARQVVLCMDMGHYHPTETIHDKISAHLAFHPRLLLHTSRPIRWDSDHVVLFDDNTRAVFLEVARGNAWDRVFVALDFFDASINRVAAYVIGTRATRKAILYSLLDPTAILKDYEKEGKNAQRLGLMEEFKLMPFGAVWDMLCQRDSVPPASAWLPEVEAYEARILGERG